MKPFEDVVAEYGATVLRVCRAVVGADDAEDAWSETFLSALRAYPRLPPGTNVEAWLVTIAHRRALDAGRAGPAPGSNLQHRRPAGRIQRPRRPRPEPVDGSGPTSRQTTPGRRLPPHRRSAVRGDRRAARHLPDAARRAAADGIKTLRKAYQKDQSA
ncbi:sigma-70 region 2 family protein [Mycobacterium xenopi 3993]|nr:sigma-70 region 2 family protein [Mycobacterium xenopi 3993]